MVGRAQEEELSQLEAEAPVSKLKSSEAFTASLRAIWAEKVFHAKGTEAARQLAMRAKAARDAHSSTQLGSQSNPVWEADRDDLLSRKRVTNIDQRHREKLSQIVQRLKVPSNRQPANVAIGVPVPSPSPQWSSHSSRADGLAPTSYPARSDAGQPSEDPEAVRSARRAELADVEKKRRVAMLLASAFREDLEQLVSVHAELLSHGVSQSTLDALDSPSPAEPQDERGIPSPPAVPGPPLAPDGSLEARLGRMEVALETQLARFVEQCEAQAAASRQMAQLLQASFSLGLSLQEQQTRTAAALTALASQRPPPPPTPPLPPPVAVSLPLSHETSAAAPLLAALSAQVEGLRAEHAGASRELHELRAQLRPESRPLAATRRGRKRLKAARRATRHAAQEAETAAAATDTAAVTAVEATAAPAGEALRPSWQRQPAGTAEAGAVRAAASELRTGAEERGATEAAAAEAAVPRTRAFVRVGAARPPRAGILRPRSLVRLAHDAPSSRLARGHRPRRRPRDGRGGSAAAATGDETEDGVSAACAEAGAGPDAEDGTGCSEGAIASCARAVEQTVPATRPLAAAAASGMCTLCCERGMDAVMYRCGHLCACMQCAHYLLSQKAPCPICRAPVEDVVRLFKVH